MEYKMVRNANFLNMKNEEPVDLLVNRSTVSCYTSIFFFGRILVARNWLISNLLQSSKNVQTCLKILKNIYMNIKDNLFNEIEHFHDLNPRVILFTKTCIFLNYT